MTERIEGRCLCGSFRFVVTGPLGDVRLCHCETCRRANGSAFSANCRVPIENFAVLTDIASIAEYQSSPGAWNAFCAICGSPAYSRVEWDADGIRVRLGTLDRDAQPNIVAHVWVDSKAAWDNICDDLPCYAEGADGPLSRR